MKSDDVMPLRQSIAAILAEKQKSETGKKKKGSGNGKIKINMNDSIPVDTRSGGKRSTFRSLLISYKNFWCTCQVGLRTAPRITTLTE
jgi:hypothetical protein